MDQHSLCEQVRRIRSELFALEEMLSDDDTEHARRLVFGLRVQLATVAREILNGMAP
jgi:hypothetical protein